MNLHNTAQTLFRRRWLHPISRNLLLDREYIGRLGASRNGHYALRLVCKLRLSRRLFSFFAQTLVLNALPLYVGQALLFRLNAPTLFFRLRCLAALFGIGNALLFSLDLVVFNFLSPLLLYTSIFLELLFFCGNTILFSRVRCRFRWLYHRRWLLDFRRWRNFGWNHHRILGDQCRIDRQWHRKIRRSSKIKHDDQRAKQHNVQDHREGDRCDIVFVPSHSALPYSGTG